MPGDSCRGLPVSPPSVLTQLPGKCHVNSAFQPTLLLASAAQHISGFEPSIFRTSLNTYTSFCQEVLGANNKLIRWRTRARVLVLIATIGCLVVLRYAFLCASATTFVGYLPRLSFSCSSNKHKQQSALIYRFISQRASIILITPRS